MMNFPIEAKEFLRPAMQFPPPCRGRARVGVGFGLAYGKRFYPHPNLPPARGKEREFGLNAQDATVFIFSR
jgi:hypothetical protein